MSQRAEETHPHEARREAASVAVCSSAVLTLLALVSWREGWEVVSFPWWTWLVLAIPGLVLCLDLWLGTGGLGARGRNSALVLLGLIVAGNVAGLALLISSLVTTRSADIGGGQLLMTAAVIWVANILAFAVWYWEVDDGGPFARANKERRTPDFQFPQDENPELARRSPWRPRIWDYLYVSLTAASAFSPTDAMPLTYRAKALLGIESTVSLVIVVLVTARAVNVLGS
jgi:uncharacterized membrane protein